MKRLPRITRFPRPEDGLRAVVERAPQAEAIAASWIEVARPTLLLMYSLRRRIATISVTLLAVSLFVHVMFGANGMVVYKQKRAELEALRKQIDQVQRENERYTQQIQGLKSDQTSIEKRSAQATRLRQAGRIRIRSTRTAEAGSAYESFREKIAR